MEFERINIFIGANGSGKSNYLKSLGPISTPDFQRMSKSDFDEYLDMFFYNVSKVHVNNGDIELTVGGGRVPLSDFSEGTKHLMDLLCLLSTENHVLLIEEPEKGLHPAWQKLLAFEILICNNFDRCFISTHSPDFLDEFTERFLRGDVGVFVFDQSSRTPIRKLDKESLRPELEKWTLGDLYRIGDPLIGGWPQ